MFQRILIANRGEIAVRVMKTAHRLGIECVAVYSDIDRNAMHVRMADQGVCLGGASAQESYLNMDAVIQAAKDTGAQAIHPGYGFLSENAEFVRKCEENDIVFIGPSESAMLAMALKDKAKATMEEAGVPVVPGYQGDNQDPDFLKGEADQIGYPVLIKAVAGGGGKGMRLVEKESDFLEGLEACQREAKSAFGNAHVLIEKFITKPRHIEIQVFGDTYGNAVHLFERDCSLQRRHQKVVEEAPAPDVSDAMRKAMGDAAVRAAKAIGYSGAGTVEFIVDSANGLREDGFFFMEMNTRLQVEHPVTEEITGQDLVEWQLRVAAGESLPCAQEDLSLSGHAFEVRLYAEDPANDFLPQTGDISRFDCGVEGVRFDTGVEAGDAISIHYDPMVAKIIVHGEDRKAALQKMRDALHGTLIDGLTTNQEFLRRVFAHDAFENAAVDTGFIARHHGDLLPEEYGLPSVQDIALAIAYSLYAQDMSGDNCAQDPWSAKSYWRMDRRQEAVTRQVVLFDRKHTEFSINCLIKDNNVRFGHDGEEHILSFKSYDETTMMMEIDFNHARMQGTIFMRDGDAGFVVQSREGERVVWLSKPDYDNMAEGQGGEGRMLAPMPGRIVSLLVQAQEKVKQGQTLLVMEAMKMEVAIKADCDGVVEDLPIAQGDQVDDGALLVFIERERAEA